MSKVRNAPDYSDCRQKFRLSAYYAPSDGTWNHEGEVFSCGTDFRTVERFKEYLDSGLNMMFVTGSESSKYLGEDWETSAAKMIMDRAYEAGITEQLVNDIRLREHIAAIPGGVIGEGKLFKNEDELDKRVAECMEPYRYHPAFFGVLLRDEPRYTMLESVGQVFRSIKRVCPGAFVHCNLWPPAASTIGTWLPPEGKTIEPCWKAYLKSFVEKTGAKFIQYDQYPFQDGFIAQGYFKGLQMSAEFCRDNDVDFYFTSQAFGMYMGDRLHHRPVKEADARFLSNAMLGFGVKEISYYTYWTYQNSSAKARCIDGTSFVTLEGKKTPVYDFMRRINQELQKFAPVILNFTYQASTYFAKEKINYCNDHVTDYEFYGMKKDKLSKVEAVEHDKETIIVTELKDFKNNRYMHMVQNIIDTANDESEETKITVKLTYPKEFERAAVYDRGVAKYHDLDCGKITFTLAPGQAKFIIPY